MSPIPIIPGKKHLIILMIYYSKNPIEESSSSIYPNEQLGKKIDLISSIKTGIADKTITGGIFQNRTDIAVFADMPFIFCDFHLKKLAAGCIGRMMAERILEETGIGIIRNM
jgi:TRAP-type C4-dicarboxylate transport system substrate-binding protein